MNGVAGNSGHAIGAPYWRTEVGAYDNSDSPYGTFDQGGNVYEWTEVVANNGVSSYRITRGGSFSSPGTGSLWASFRIGYDMEYYHIGFRVAYVPEPGSAILLVCGGGALVRRRSRWWQ